MTKLFTLLIFLLLFLTPQAFSQTIDALRNNLQHILSTKNVVGGVAITGHNGNDTLSVNGHNHFPLQSVFKLHIAIAVLSQIDQGKLSLAQKITIDKKDFSANLYSPIREKYPTGTTLTIAAILKYTIAESDNVGCDILLKLVGGPGTVEAYFKAHNFKDISIKFNEATQQPNWDLQFQNWTTPISANEVLVKFYHNKTKLLSPKLYDFLWKTMKATATGKDRLKGALPQGTIVAHKTGTSGINKDGVTAAVNDIGIVFLPTGEPYFISVFITSSKEDAGTNEKIISDISRATWDYFNGRVK